MLIPLAQFVTLYPSASSGQALLETLNGIGSMEAWPALLFSTVGLPRLVGSNATQIVDGCTRRGEATRQAKPERGPLRPQCLAQNICKLPVGQLEAFFTGVVRRSVASGPLEGELPVALDGSKVLTTEHEQGRGCLEIEHEQRVKLAGVWQVVTLVERPFGWKSLS
ncbi:MAG: hypothetical protein IT307_20845 [Chloroflexi bacterium]|nr:hypothetical protein [Chloroflexota bacterium]